MSDFIKKPIFPERVNVHQPTTGRIAFNPSRPPQLPLARSADIPRAYERMNDLLGEPGDKALQWRDLGGYLYGPVSDATCRALALNVTETTLDVARSTLLAADKRGVFGFENLPWCDYRPWVLSTDTSYTYPSDIDLHLPFWGGRGQFNRLADFQHPLQFDYSYSDNPEEFSAQLVDQDRRRFFRWSFPFQEANPVMMPSRIVNADGTRRDVVVYESDQDNVESAKIFPINGKLTLNSTPADIRASCLLRQTAGTPLGASSGVTLALRGWRDAAAGDDLTVQDDISMVVPFDANGRGFVSFAAGSVTSQLMTPVLTFGADIAQGTRIEIYHILMNTVTLRRVG